MNTIKRLLSLLLCTAMLLSLCACGAQDAAAGEYTGTAVTGGGTAVVLTDLYPAGLQITLQNNSSAKLTTGDTTTRGTWTRTQGDELVLTFGENTLSGTQRNDILTLVDPEHADLTFILRRSDETGLSVPVTALTLEEAIGNTLGTADFLSPTKKLYAGMKLYGAMRFSNITQADGSKDAGEMFVDVWGCIDKDVNGNSFLEVFTAEEYEGTDPVLSLYIKLAPNLIAPVIGKENAWLGSMYLTNADAKYFAVRLQNGALNFSVPYKDPSGYTCTIDIVLREKDTPWDLHGDRFTPTGVTMAEIEETLSMDK